jgi:hypothetical protein
LRPGIFLSPASGLLQKVLPRRARIPENGPMLQPLLCAYDTSKRLN